MFEALARLVDRHAARHRFPVAWHVLGWCAAAYVAYSTLDMVRAVFGLSWALGIVALVSYIVWVVRGALAPKPFAWNATPEHERGRPLPPEPRPNDWR